MTTITIRRCYTGEPIATVEAASLREAVERLVAAGTPLACADLTGAQLAGAVLTGADMTCADMSRADLTRTDLAGARLVGAALVAADMTGARLTLTDMSGTDLIGARLTGTVLTGARLTVTVLTGVDMTHVNLTDIRNDLFDVLERAPAEVPALLAALEEGRNACQVVHDLRGLPRRPAERFVSAICRGDTAANNPVAAVVAGWIREWLATRDQHR